MSNQPPPPYPFWMKATHKREPDICDASRCKALSVLHYKDDQLCQKHWEAYCLKDVTP